MKAFKLRAYASLTLLGTEAWRAAMEFMSLKINDLMQKSPVLAGDGHPVIIFPGLVTDGSGVTPLRDYCKSLGYQAIDWGQGYNTGPKDDLEPRLNELASHTANILQRYDQPATLIGRSLGGIYAREMGKLLAPPGDHHRHAIQCRS